MSLPAYSVRTSPRAKHVRLKVTVQKGLEVIIPRGFNEGRLPGLLAKRKDWISKALAQVEEQRKFFEPEPPGYPPEHIYLRAVDEEVYSKVVDGGWGG